MSSCAAFLHYTHTYFVGTMQCQCAHHCSGNKRPPSRVPNLGLTPNETTVQQCDEQQLYTVSTAQHNKTNLHTSVTWSVTTARIVKADCPAPQPEKHPSDDMRQQLQHQHLS